MCVCVCVCVCHNEKKVPDEWQARQARQAILQVSSSKHNAKKITTRVRGPFHQSITAILTEEKREEKQFTKPTHVQSTCFGTKIETGVDSKDDSGSQGQYREERREARGKMTLTVHVCVCVCVCVRERQKIELTV